MIFPASVRFDSIVFTENIRYHAGMVGFDPGKVHRTQVTKACACRCPCFCIVSRRIRKAARKLRALRQALVEALFGEMIA